VCAIQYFEHHRKKTVLHWLSVQSKQDCIDCTASCMHPHTPQGLAKLQCKLPACRGHPILKSPKAAKQLKPHLPLHAHSPCMIDLCKVLNFGQLLHWNAAQRMLKQLLALNFFPWFVTLSHAKVLEEPSHPI